MDFDPKIIEMKKQYPRTYTFLFDLGYTWICHMEFTDQNYDIQYAALYYFRPQTQ